MDPLVFLSWTLLAWLPWRVLVAHPCLKVYFDYPWPGFGGPIVLHWFWKRIVALEILSRRVLVTVFLKETWYWTYTPSTCETIVFHCRDNIPRKTTIFCERPKTRPIHSSLTYRIEIPIDHSLLWKGCTFDRYKGTLLREKLRNISLGVINSFLIQKKDSTRD